MMTKTVIAECNNDGGQRLTSGGGVYDKYQKLVEAVCQMMTDRGKVGYITDSGLKDDGVVTRVLVLREWRW